MISLEKPKPKGRPSHGPQKPVSVCWGGKGHCQDQCPSPKQDTDSTLKDSSSSMPKPRGSASAVVAAVALLDEVAGA